MKNTIGVVGLAVMGQNLARNFASRKIKTAVFNRSPQKTISFCAQYENEFLHGFSEIQDFCKSIQRPRKILLMVKAGSATDATIEAILPFLEKDDILLDGGNAFFSDTRRREKYLFERGIAFVGCGVSGGEEGALKGPSMMPGGKKHIVETLLPLLKEISATDFSGGKCVSNIGSDGAGHFVKMVHNGIEYAVMQFLAEGFALLRANGKHHEEIVTLFQKWNTGPLASFLVELSEKIVGTKEGDDFLLEKVVDCAAQKGTGKWTVESAVSLSVAIPTIAAAVDARIFSSQKSLRETLETTQNLTPNNTTNFSEDDLERALFSAMLTAYAEGFSLIATAAEQYKWEIHFSELARIWQGGCIIRADILRFLETQFSKNPIPSHLFLFPEIAEKLAQNSPALRAVCSAAISAGIAIPALSAAANEITQLFTARGSAYFLQGLRDSFGAHGFKRVDKKGDFHAEWG